MKSRKSIICFVFCLVIATIAVAEQVYWVPVAAHWPGVGTSAWRTDLSVLNLCSTEASVEIRLHTGGAVETMTVTVPANAQRVLKDLVGQITPDNASGSVEIRSDQRLMVKARTYNQADVGTFGQGFSGLEATAGLSSGDMVYMQQLQEDPASRTNIGALNMGPVPAEVSVRLFDGAGQSIGTFTLVVPARQVVQENRPYSARFARSDIGAGYAGIVVLSGTGVHVYGSVVDNTTNDPTTVVTEASPGCSDDTTPGDIEGDYLGFSTVEANTCGPDWGRDVGTSDECVGRISVVADQVFMRSCCRDLGDSEWDCDQDLAVGPYSDGWVRGVVNTEENEWNDSCTERFDLLSARGDRIKCELRAGVRLRRMCLRRR